MALAERLEELQRPKNGLSSSRRRTLQPRTTLLFTTTYGSILLLLLLLLFFLSLHCVNGQYSPYNEHAKFPSLFRSSAAVAAAVRSQQTAFSATADKDGGASEEAVLKSSTGENAAAAAADNSLKQWSSFAEGADFNVNLDIGLVDVEPEANLFLDETPLLARTGGGGASSSSASQQRQDTSSRSNGGSSVRETRHLALVHSASSVVVRATYGPFTARQTINPFSVPKNTSSSPTTTAGSSSSSSWSASSAKELKNKSTTTTNNVNNVNNVNSRPAQSSAGAFRNSNFLLSPEQITAYLVTKEVRRSHPVLRVLFYASHLAEYRSHASFAQSSSFSSMRGTPGMEEEEEEDKTLCAAVIVQYHGERLFGTCSPSSSKQNACLAEVTIPALYWPPLDVSNGGLYAAKQQKSSTAKVYYTIAHTAAEQACTDQNFLSLLAASSTETSNDNGGEGQNSKDSNRAAEQGEPAVNADLAAAAAHMNLVYLSEVSLVPFRGSYEEVTNDNVVTVLIPQEPVYPNSKIYIPVKYTYNPDYPVAAFSLRVQVKPGLKILGAQLSHPNKLWQLSVELGAKQTTATVTAFLRDFVGGGGGGGGGVPLDQQQPNSGQQFGQQQQQSDSSGGSGQSGQSSGQLLPDELLENSSQEVYSWLIEVEGDIDISEVNGRIVWQLLYNTDMEAIVGKGGGGGGGGNGGNGGNVNFLPLVDMQAQQSQQAQEDEDFERESVKLTSLIDIQKDVVAEVLAITRRRELLNTALLNGRQVSRAMRVLQVSAAGSISDITFQCSCQSADESILKVSPSCTSVYLDGSEVRGSQNASVLIKYGSFTGLGSFIVWMPLIPLDVRVADSKLSQIKGWRVPFYLPKRQSLLTTMTNNNPFAEFNENTESRFDFLDQQMLMDRAERSSGGGSGGGGGLSEADKYPWTASASAGGSSAGGSSSAGGASSSSGNSGSCRLRYQQTRVEVYTRFLSTDHNSGREASLLNRRHSLRITHLVRPLIRVTDGKVLRLRAGGAQVEGVGVGRADVEVISPLTGSVIGSREVRVTADREAISRLEVRPVSGLKLQVEPPRLEGGSASTGGRSHIWATSVELNSRLTKQYQEALLDGRLLFTDGTVVALSELSPADYDLSVDTFKGVVAHVSRGVSGVVSSSSSSAHHAHLNNGGGSSSASSVHHSVFGHSAHHELPRIIALLPGQGELVHLTLDLPYACQRKKKSQPLASAYVDIDVHFQLPELLEEEERQGQQGHSSSLQNDAINGYGRGRLSGGSGGGGRLHGLNDTISKGGSKDAFRLMGGGGGGGGLLKKRPSSMLSSRRGGLLYQSAAAEERERITYQRHSGTSSVNSVNQKASGGGGGMGTGVGGSHLELGMYSLLTVVSVASIIVVVLYSVFSLRNYSRHGGGKGDGHVTTTATSENGGGEDGGGGGLRGVSRQFLSCVNSSSSSPGGHHTHRHHRGYHHHQSGGSSSGGVQVTNAAKEWVWVGGSHFNGGSRCGGGAVRQSQQQQQENENEPSEEMLEVRRPLLPMHHLHHQHYHHHHQHRNYHHPHCTDHNGNLTMTSTEATKSATGARQAPLLHGSSTLELEVQLGSSSSTAHGRQSGSSGLSGGGGTGGGGTGGFRITANPAETLLLATSGQFDFQEQLPGTLGARSDEPEDLPPSSTAATATAASLISRRQQQQQQQQQCTEPNATLLQSVLIPMNHKSTRIKTTSSSGLSFLRAASPLDEPPPPPPIPARTRHIPLPKGGSSNCTKPTIGAGKGVQKKGPSPPIWRHHHNQPLQSWQELTGGGQEQQQEQATSSSSSAPPPPPIPPHKSQRGSGSDSASSDLSAGSSTHSHSHSHSRPPPIPPHRAGSNGSVSSRTLSSASTSSSSASTGGNQREGRSPQPVRPKHLRLAKRHTPQNSGVHHHSNTVGGNVELLQQEQQQQQPPPPLDYRAMMKVLERLKESSA